LVDHGLLPSVFGSWGQRRTFFSGDSTSVDDAGSYHIAHAKIAIGSGGLLGVGIGNSVQATGYLPEAMYCARLRK
jgi:cell division protein FtsW